MTTPRPSPPLACCAALAAAQRGLISRRQASEAGMTRHAIAAELARGSWLEVRRGVYRAAAAPPTWHQRALATCLGGAAAAALSHRSAAFLHGLLEVAPEPLEVVVAYGSATTDLAGLARVRRSRTLERRDVVVLGGIRATSLPRTLADLAATVPQRDLDELVDRALRARPSDAARARLVGDLEGRLRDSRRRRGGPALRGALSPWTADPRRSHGMESVLEAQVMRVLIAAGVPAPRVQHGIVLGGGRSVRLDFAWPEPRVALEVDGYAYHSSRASFEEDRARGNLLLAEGWEVLRTTAGEVRRRPGALVAAVTATLAARAPTAAAPAAQPDV